MRQKDAFPFGLPALTLAGTFTDPVAATPFTVLAHTSGLLT